VANRKTHRSRSGKKLDGERGKSGQFKDTQTEKRAHKQDIKRNSRKFENTLITDLTPALLEAFHSYLLQEYEARTPKQEAQS
jgi:hypothetical protein